MRSCCFFIWLCFLGLSFSVSAANQPVAAKHPIDGAWHLNLETNDVGAVRTVMTLKVTGETFEGHSRPNADKALIGFSKATMGRVFTNYFKNGALLHLQKGKLKMVAENEYKVAAVLASASGQYLFRGTVKDNQLAGHLTNGRDEEILGTVRGVKGAASFPMDKYPVIMEQALAQTRAKLFDPRKLNTKEWQTFEKAMTGLAQKAQDDLDLVFGFYYYGSKLPFSHYALYRMDPQTEKKDSAATFASEFLALETVKPGTMLFTIRSFSGTSRSIDSVFTLIREKNPANLIIDLRGNSGGNISGLKVATNLAEKEYPGGTFVTKKWFEQNTAPPAAADMEKFPALTEANLSLLWDGIHNQTGLKLQVIPEPVVYRGKVFILTDKVTASTCEPLVYGLKLNKRATVVGEKTAGAMLNGENFKLHDWWQVTIPTADYYTSDGQRLDKVGVEPHYRLAGKEALTYVLQNLVE